MLLLEPEMFQNLTKTAQNVTRVWQSCYILGPFFNIRETVETRMLHRAVEASTKRATERRHVTASFI